MPSQYLCTECLSCKNRRWRYIHKATKVAKGAIIVDYCVMCRQQRHLLIVHEL
jgi:hypothetical protein